MVCSTGERKCGFQRLRAGENRPDSHVQQPKYGKILMMAENSEIRTRGALKRDLNDPIQVVGGIIRRDGKYLLGKRPQGKSQGGRWEFIGGKIEKGETPEEALSRECMEEIALPTVNHRIRTSVTHTYPEKTICLTLIDCEPRNGAEPQALEHECLGWFSADEMQALDFCPADRELLPVVLN